MNEPIPPTDEERDAEAAADEAVESPEAPAEPSPEEVIRDLEDRLRRTQAEFVNETKRMKRQAEERIRYATDGLVEDLLPVFDALHSARDGFASQAAAADTAQAALDGFDLVERELLNVLGRHGITRIDAEPSLPFDPQRHHAIVMLDVPELEPGTIARELRPGFQLHERVVRPSHVAVVAERASAPDAAGGAEGGGDADL